jgi:hypothetical protein
MICRPTTIAPPTATTFDPRESTFDRLDFRHGDAETEDFTFLINTAVPLGAAEFYGFFTYGHRDGLSAANFRQQSAATNRDFSTIAPGTTPTNGNFVGLTPDGYLPKIQSNIDDVSETGGIRTEVNFLAGVPVDVSTVPVSSAGARAASNGFSNVGAARFFLNGLDTTTQGVDAVATYRADLGGLGAWNFSAAYNYTRNEIDKRLNNLGPLAQIPWLALFGRVEGIRFERGQPRSKVVMATDGKIAGVGLSARTTRYGSVISPETTARLGLMPPASPRSAQTTRCSVPNGSPTSRSAMS